MRTLRQTGVDAIECKTDEAILARVGSEDRRCSCGIFNGLLSHRSSTNCDRVAVDCA